MHSQFPPPSMPLRQAYGALIADLDRQLSALTSDRFGGRLHCGPGCSSCCTPFSVLPLEAALVAEALAKTGTLPLQPDADSCRLLSDDQCSIYQVRPVICRSQGVPIAYVDEQCETIEVSACPLNFAADHCLSHDDLLFLDPFNRRLAELNKRYCRASGLIADSRIPLLSLAAAATPPS